ncbi:MAG: GNAT family N-acetyltransferase [Lachnospiraceae bacterium]|nr:GNAT family N-acetyltransferase [Lachnospiraceae bacterium]
MAEPEELFDFTIVTPSQGDEAARVEQICFPPNEACAYKDMISRVEYAPELFLVAIDRQTGEIAGSLNGIATDEEAFRDEFFTDITLHDPKGKNIMLLGLSVLPQYRRRGLARALVKRYSEIQREQGRRSLILTCLDEKVGMYESFGFKDLGISASTWGGESWHELKYDL